jgi:3alpha(or 20beta)-hydroxysteroid dehydrogenase
VSGVLAGRVALVTGAARGIGEAIARLYHAEGARVAIADVNAAGGQALAAVLGEGALFLSLDVTQEAQWQAALDAILARWGRLDVLVNNAGIIARKGLLETEVADMEAAFRVNQLGVFLGMKLAAPALTAAGGGAIVNLSSTAGIVARPGVFAYSATKWAVRGMTKAAAAELGPAGIRVNSIHPGIIESEMTKGYGEAGKQAALAGIPLKRIGQVEDVARLALHLASAASSYSTGCEFIVDGGLTVL